MQLYSFITRSIWTYLVDRFLLADVSRKSEDLILLRTVQPVTVIDELVADPLIPDTVTKASDIVANVVFITVPANEWWDLLALYFNRAAGSRVIQDIILANTAAEADQVNIVTGIAGTTYTSGMFAQPVPLKPGWRIIVSFSGGAADGNWTLQMLYRRRYVRTPP